MSLLNATALITGGAQGFGRAFARFVLESGGRVSLLDLLHDGGIDTQNEFNQRYGPGSALFIKCDVRKKLELEAAFKKTHDIFGSLDLVVNNAGVSTIDGDWEKTIDINLTAVMRGCLLAAEYMSQNKSGKGGHIINIASTAGLYAVGFDPAYSASKTGVVGLSRALALSLSPVSIRVNCLCPSFADTAIVQQAFKGEVPGTADFRSLVDTVGLLRVDDVVLGFKKLLEDETATGGVLHVTPKGLGYRHKPSKL